MDRQQSPTVQRITAVLNFFLEHPTQPFTLTQVSKSLRLSRATAHSILLSFVAAGYLHRRPDKSYILGLALPLLAASAVQQFSPLAVAGQEMRALADELDVIVNALFQEGDHLVIRERAASVNHLGVVANRPTRKPHPLYPTGYLFKLGRSEAEYEAVLDNMTPPVTAEERAELQAAIQSLKKNGFVVRLASVTPEQADRAGPLGFLTEVRPEENYDVNYVVAPVGNDQEQVAFVISLFGFQNPLPGTELLNAGRLLHEMCQRISTFIGATRA